MRLERCFEARVDLETGCERQSPPPTSLFPGLVRTVTLGSRYKSTSMKHLLHLKLGKKWQA